MKAICSVRLLRYR